MQNKYNNFCSMQKIHHNVGSGGGGIGWYYRSKSGNGNNEGCTLVVTLCTVTCLTRS
jgi:hypothetical protein